MGKFCSISWNVSIGGGEHPQDRLTTGLLSRFYQLDAGGWDNKAKIELDKSHENFGTYTIANNVLISTGAIILRNVKIGNGVIIGAGAVVNRDIEPYSIVAGVTAKVIKKSFDDKIIESLEKTQWWNWPVDVIRNNLDLIYSTKVDNIIIHRLQEIANTV